MRYMVFSTDRRGSTRLDVFNSIRELFRSYRGKTGEAVSWSITTEPSAPEMTAKREYVAREFVTGETAIAVRLADDYWYHAIGTHPDVLPMDSDLETLLASRAEYRELARRGGFVS